MIDNMAPLKQAMEQMDAEDADMAQAGKDRAAQILGDAKMSFSKMADLIEQHRLLLRPRILTNIKRMDQPGMIGDAAFRDAGSALRREGQSFRHVADAIELATARAPRYEGPAQESEPLHQTASEPPGYDVESEPPPYDVMSDRPQYDTVSEPLQYDAVSEPKRSVWIRLLFFVASIVFFPLRHPIRFIAIAPLAVLLFYAFRGYVPVDRIEAIRDSAQQGIVSVGAFFHRSKERGPQTGATPNPSPAASPSPSASPAAPNPPTTAPAPSPNASTPPALLPISPPPPSASPAGPPASTPRREARSATSSRRSAPVEDNRLRAFEDIIPEQMRRQSRTGGPCVGGVGGCYWGGFRY